MSNNSTFFLLPWQLLQDLDDLVLQTEREELQLHWELRRLLACKTLECTVRNCSLRCQPTEYHCYQNTDVDERPVHFLSPREGGLEGFWSCHDKINPVPPKALWYSYDPPPSPPYWQLIGSQLSLVPSLYTLLVTTNSPPPPPFVVPTKIHTISSSLRRSRKKGTQMKTGGLLFAAFGGRECKIGELRDQMVGYNLTTKQTPPDGVLVPKVNNDSIRI